MPTSSLAAEQSSGSGHHHGNMDMMTENVPFPHDPLGWLVVLAFSCWESIGSELHKHVLKQVLFNPDFIGLRMKTKVNYTKSEILGLDVDPKWNKTNFCYKMEN